MLHTYTPQSCLEPPPSIHAIHCPGLPLSTFHRAFHTSDPVPQHSMRALGWVPVLGVVCWCVVIRESNADTLAHASCRSSHAVRATGQRHCGVYGWVSSKSPRANHPRLHAWWLSGCREHNSADAGSRRRTKCSQQLPARDDAHPGYFGRQPIRSRSTTLAARDPGAIVRYEQRSNAANNSCAPISRPFIAPATSGGAYERPERVVVVAPHASVTHGFDADDARSCRDAGRSNDGAPAAAPPAGPACYAAGVAPIG